MKKIFILSALFFGAISITSAANGLDGVKDSVETFGSIVGLLYGIFIGGALAAFAWGVLTFILKEDKKDSAKGLMIYSLLALIVLFSLPGIVSFFQGATGVDGTQDTLNAPKFNIEENIYSN